MKRYFLSLLLLAVFLTNSAVWGQVSVKLSSDERKTVEGVTAEQLRNYLYFVASDEMEGRDTPSRGLDTTAKFIGMNLNRWGFKPAGDDGTFYQHIDLLRYKINLTATTVNLAGQQLVWGTDYLAAANAGSVSSAPIVFGGNGWFIKSKNIAPLTGVDVKGKVVVVYSEPSPKGMNFQQLRALGKQGVDWMDPVSYAKQNGAVGIIFLATPGTVNAWDRTRRQREAGGGYFVEKLRTSQPDKFPSITLSQKQSENLFTGESTNLDAIVKAYNADQTLQAFPLGAGKTAAINVATDEDRARTQNVVAVWEGDDPVLKNEMVAIGAHYDHVGTNPNAQGPDKIWNGADDDGSGTVSVLSIAEALAKAHDRPKRSVLFVWHCGEEKGLWGSQYFNAFPTVNIKNVIAQLNIDMIGRSKKMGDTNPRNKDLTDANSVYVIGKDMMSSTLGGVVDAVNKSYLSLGYDTRYDDPKDPNRFFFRSDHFNYALNGIPITFWFDGVHEDYHQPGDEPQKIDYDKMEKVARTIMLTLLELTDLKDRPKIDKQLPPELSSRN
jgi:hypothetical protein